MSSPSRARTPRLPPALDDLRSTKLTCLPVLRLSTPFRSTIRTEHSYVYPRGQGVSGLTGRTAASNNPYPDVKSQKAFEKALLEKTAKQTGDILLFDGRM